MTESAIKATIEGFWRARVAGDMHALTSFMAPDAIYEMVGANAFAEPETVGPHRMESAAARLVEIFTFHNVETRTVIVDGARAAVVNRLEVAFRDRAPVATEACDLWEFDAAGKITSLRQFVDTDLVRRMFAGEV